MEKKTIGTFIAALRKANGLTQKQLADMLNVSDKAVSRWERDECAPDLSLIPVLAEIFNVTSDEILRGQKNNPDTAPKTTDDVKSQRQRAHLLRSTQSRFRIRTVVCGGIILLGLILAWILNAELNAPNAGFLVCLICNLIASAFQITGLISAYASLSDSDEADGEIQKCRTSMGYWLETVITAAILSLSLVAPMAGSQERLSFLNCLTAGCKWALIAAIFCFLVCRIIDICRKHPRQDTLCRSVTSLLLIAVLVGHLCFNTFLLNNRHLYAPHETFDDPTSFRDYMLDCRTQEGYPAHVTHKYHSNINNQRSYLFIYENPYTQEKIIYTQEELTETLTTPTDPNKTATDRFIPELGYEFIHFNRNIVHYEITNKDSIAPIYTFNPQQFRQSQQSATVFSLIYCVAYLVPMAIGYLLRRKQK